MAGVGDERTSGAVGWELAKQLGCLVDHRVKVVFYMKYSH